MKRRSSRPTRRVPVVDSLTPASFAAQHLRGARPAIVAPRDDDPLAIRLAPLADPAHVRDLLGDAPIRIRNGNAAALLTGATSGETTATTYGTFADRLDAEPTLELVCSEHATPAALAGPAAVPAFADVGDDADRVSDMFLAGPAATAHLHYDGDLRDVVMLQLFGHKRYVLIDPVHSAKLLPLTGAGVQRTSGVFLEHLEGAERDAFVRYTAAYECTLGPGEALYMPAGWWHYVEYLDVSLSVNHRLGRNRELRTLAEQVPVPSVEWLWLAQVFRDAAAAERSPTCRAVWSALEHALAATEPLAATDPAERAAVLERVCLQLCADLGAPIAGPPATMVDLDRRARLTSPVRSPSSPAAVATPAGSVSSEAPQPPEVLPMPTPAVPDTPADTTADTTPDTTADMTRPDAATWTEATRVQVPAGSALFVPVQDRGLALAQGDQLVAIVPPDPVHHWTLPVLTRVARQPGVTIGELAAVSDAPVAHVAAFLAQMADAGWVARTP